MANSWAATTTNRAEPRRRAAVDQRLHRQLRHRLQHAPRLETIRRSWCCGTSRSIWRGFIEAAGDLLNTIGDILDPLAADRARQAAQFPPAADLDLLADRRIRGLINIFDSKMGEGNAFLDFVGVSTSSPTSSTTCPAWACSSAISAFQNADGDSFDDYDGFIDTGSRAAGALAATCARRLT
jgi:hypothetical protein